MSKPRLFIGGIMQGSSQAMEVCDQSYRDQIAKIVHCHHPDVEIVDPFQIHPDGVTYDRERAVQTFLRLLDTAAEADVLIAYLPHASLGTALEIWRAYEAGKPVIAISPMDQNWALWATTHRIVPSLAAFEQFVAAGGLTPFLTP
ncbi:MAG: hypothetical protein JW934_13015 [Anaerolineae bacterium]|nr:hypothetical protein [Anaerolineae bacterium]